MTVLNIHALIDEATGETNLGVLKALSYRRAMADYGSICPKSLRQALKFYGSHLAQMQAAWCQRNGQPVAMTAVTAFGQQTDGVRRSAF